MAWEDERSVIFEMIVIGRYVKVSAVDMQTGVEASIVGDPRRGERALRQAALRRLRYVMQRGADSENR